MKLSNLPLAGSGKSATCPPANPGGGKSLPANPNGGKFLEATRGICMRRKVVALTDDISPRVSSRSFPPFGLAGSYFPPPGLAGGFPPGVDLTISFGGGYF